MFDIVIAHKNDVDMAINPLIIINTHGKIRQFLAIRIPMHRTLKPGW